MLRAVEQAEVKHAYAATGCYAHAIVSTQRLLAAGLIGQVYESESVLHMNVPSGRLPYGWVHQLGQGGRLFNNVFTHKVAQVLRATGGQVGRAAGEARFVVEHAPVGPVIHDFGDLFRLSDRWDPDAATAGRPVDADMAYTVTLMLQLPHGNNANVVFRGSVLTTTPEPEYLAFHGEGGSRYMCGSHGADDRIRHFAIQHQRWEDLPLPPDVMATDARATVHS